jgi:acyl-coenzyme A thioesterase PaaI-like protein
MRLAFDRDDARQRIVGRFRLGPEFQGGGGFIHGGIIATVLDEVMSKATRFSVAERAVTAELRVEYLKPIPVDEELCVEGFLTRREGRQLYHEGEIRNQAGVLLARGQGRFVVIEPRAANAAETQAAKIQARDTQATETRAKEN